MSRKKGTGAAPRPSSNAPRAGPAKSSTSGRESLPYLQSLIDSIEDGLLVVDRNFRIVKANKNFLSRVAKTEADVVGQPCYEVLRSGSKECLVGGSGCPSRLVFETGRPAETTASLQRQTGHPQILHIHASPVFNQHNQVYQAIEVIRDITETKQLEARLANAERYVAISRIAASVAHEINTPMSAVATCVEGLERRVRGLSGAPTEQREEIIEYLEIIKQSACRCKAIAERLLSYSSRAAFRQEAVDLNDVLRSVCRLVEFDASQANKKIALQLAPLPVVLHGDRAQLSELFLNLMLNAIDATEPGDEISIAMEVDRGKVTVAVRDTGVGISPDIMDKIFEPFFTTKQTSEGAGLGLAICRDIAKKHHGTIYVESEPGVGSAFFVELPLPKRSCHAQ
jgi:PAS domain S-box-containing protein